jgi:formylglycine-generating enzyme required for sulfatase activity
MLRTVLLPRVLPAVALFIPAFALLLPCQAQTDKEPAKKGWGKEITNSIGMKLVRIPPGKFRMGSTKEEQDRAIEEHEKWLGKKPTDFLVALYRAEGPRHGVVITEEFWLGVTEVTQKQFKTVMGYNPSFFSSDGKGKSGDEEYKEGKPAGGKDRVQFLDTSDFPVENVGIWDAVRFCRKLSDLPAEKKAGRQYHLPTEAEWEYACRGGASTSEPFHFGKSLSGKQANFNGKEPSGGVPRGRNLGRTCKVGSYKPNAFGLYDLHGNVAEWCNDWYEKDYYGKSPPRDPSGPRDFSDTVFAKVFRGGAWRDSGEMCRSAKRMAGPPAIVRVSWVGFRVHLAPPDSSAHILRP